MRNIYHFKSQEAGKGSPANVENMEMMRQGKVDEMGI